MSKTSSTLKITSLELIKRHPFFNGLSDDLLQKLSTNMSFREISRNKYVFREGNTADFLSFIFTGRLQVISLTEDGKEVGLNYIEAGDFYGETILIENGQHATSVITCETSLLGFLPKKVALQLFYSHPTITERIFKRLCQIIHKQNEYKNNLGSSKAFTRIYSILFGKTNIHAPTIDGTFLSEKKPLPLTIDNLPNQKSIAIMANVSRETVSRAIQVLIKSGIIQKDTKRIIIKDPELLKKLVNGSINVGDIQFKNHRLTSGVIND